MRAIHRQLIQSLANDSPQTAAKLAGTLNVSVRSVRTYVREINDAHPGSIVSSSRGYKIDRDRAADALGSSAVVHLDTSKERSAHIVNKLLMQPEGAEIDLWDLADEMCVSMSTLKSDLARSKRALARNDIELVNRRDRISISGTERNKRKLLSSMLRNETRNGFMSVTALSRAFPAIDIERTRQATSDVLYRHHRFINDFALSDLLLHIAISIDRISRSESIESAGDAVLPAEDQAIAREIAHELEKTNSIDYPAGELYELTLLVMARSTDIDYRSATEGNLAQLIGTDCMELVRALVEQFNDLYGIDLSGSGFLVRFGLHIRGLLVRARAQKPSRNPLTGSVKANCPLIYDAAVALASSISDKTGIMINDDEIAYIALHLGSAVETQRSAASKARATLFCPEYYDMGSRLADYLTGQLADTLIISQIATDEAELATCSDDMVICVSPLQVIPTVPAIQVSPFPSPSDITVLRERIDEILAERRRASLKEMLVELTGPDRFEIVDGLADYSACIDHMGKRLVAQGFAGEDYIGKALEREHMSSTAMDAFAIPHTVGLVGKHSCISILISKTPIAWQGCQVSLVLMLCFSPQERATFNTVFDRIAGSLVEPVNIQRLLACKTYEAFVDELAKLAS